MHKLFQGKCLNCGADDHSASGCPAACSGQARRICHGRAEKDALEHGVKVSKARKARDVHIRAERGSTYRR